MIVSGSGNMRRIPLTGTVKKQAALDNANKVTREQIEQFLELCRVKYLRAKIEPGQPPPSTSGAVADIQDQLLELSERNLSVNPEPR